ncbi:MAG TPA: NAD(P)-dependent alcohol dehydrogenase [Dokdonella sp.]|jgi:NADPH:quinone reductase-like Zn-dependent oxidoreductase|nr:NAD(P)-dependent alcohol dehydrogenase [Dokdonella sp.]
MKAITYAEYGPPEVLKLQDVARPSPKDGEVLIRVHAAEATKSDCEMRSFRFSVKWFWLPLRLAIGLRKPRRPILGGYFAGVVEALGAGVSGYSVGEAVFGSASLKLGAYAEYVALPAGFAITAKPANMRFAEAAAVPLGGLNALHFMRLAGIKAGQKILIIGAGGSIGLHAVQIARAMGAEVTAVDSTIKLDLLRRMGAVHVIDYTRENFADAGRTYDVVFDMVAQTSFAACMKVLTADGTYLCGNPRLSIMLRSLWTSRFTRRTASFAFARESRAELEALRDMIEDGRIRPIVDRVYPMEQAAEAHRRVETEQRLGAVVIAIDESAG